MGTRHCVARRLGRCRRGVLNTRSGVLILRARLCAGLMRTLARFVPRVRIGTGRVTQLSYLLSFTGITHRGGCVHPIVRSGSMLSVHRNHRPMVRGRLPVKRGCVTGGIVLSDDARRVVVVANPGVTNGSTLLHRATLVALLTRVNSFIPTRDTRVKLISGVFAHIKTDSGVSMNRSAFVIRVGRTTSVLGGISSQDLMLFSRLKHNASACSNVSVT